MSKKFVPYQPHYSLEEKFKRYIVLGKAGITASLKYIYPGSGFSASIEITDKCNAGCNYCYAYPSNWNQQERLKGYLNLSPFEQTEKQKNLLKMLETLKSEGVVHLVVVGGEPSLVPDTIKRAAELFPLIWIVTNGVMKLPKLPHSAVIFVSLDGPPDYHNRLRDPNGFFSNHRYGNITGMMASIIKNINDSDRGAFCQLTLTPASLPFFSETIDWLVENVKKLRGIVVTGVTAKNVYSPIAFKLSDRQKLKEMITSKAEQYGWNLFPFNQPKVNEFLTDKNSIIYNPSDCFVAQRVKSLDFDGKNVGKCLLRDEACCETCVANMIGLSRAIQQFDFPTLRGILRASFG